MVTIRLDDALSYQGQENGGDVPSGELWEGSSNEESAWIE